MADDTAKLIDHLKETADILEPLMGVHPQRVLWIRQAADALSRLTAACFSLAPITLFGIV